MPLGVDADVARLNEESPSNELSATLAAVFYLKVIDETGAALADEAYTLHQDDKAHEGRLDAGGCVFFFDIDKTKPFRFEVAGRVCAIRQGALLLNVDDPAMQYGGMLFDWNLADDLTPVEGSQTETKADRFWGEYAQADFKPAIHDGPSSFWQHEHITRRDVRITEAYLRDFPDKTVVIQAMPIQIRVGPLIRYTSANTAVIWAELETPGIVRVKYKRATSKSDIDDTSYAATVAVGGRHFAAVVLADLDENEGYAYTLELIPFPAVDPLPVEELDLMLAFPTFSPRVLANFKKQLCASSFDRSQWMYFHTLKRDYDKHLRFAHGSCFKPEGRGRNAFPRLGEWLSNTKPSETHWPRFLLLTGDQIYADDIGEDIGYRIIRQRFASRVPGPKDDIGDGAWAGRFAHRHNGTNLDAYAKANLESREELERKIKKLVRQEKQAKLKEHRRRADEWDGKSDPFGSDHWDWIDEKEPDYDLETKKLREQMEEQPYWSHVKKNAAIFPMRLRYRIYNHLLWKVPVAEKDLPRVRSVSIEEREGVPYRRAGVTSNPGQSHRKPAVHATDFAEFAYLYEHAWTTGSAVQRTLASVPSYMIFDDHEITDDWNFNKNWIDLIHTDKDPFHYWPATIADGLAAYWLYQGWCNQAPGSWEQDERTRILLKHRKQGTDALADLRALIRQKAVCPPGKRASVPSQLDWYYELPTNPPVLVLDGRTQRLLLQEDQKSQVMTDAQFDWLKRKLQDTRRPVAFIVAGAPIVVPASLSFAERWSVIPDRHRRGKDFEHWVADTSWQRVQEMLLQLANKPQFPLKSVVVLSGDVHFSYNMVANNFKKEKTSGWNGQEKTHEIHLHPELVQLVCSAFRNEASRDEKELLRQLLDEPGAAESSVMTALTATARGLVGVTTDGVFGGMRIRRGGFDGVSNRIRSLHLENAAAIVDVWFSPQKHPEVAVLLHETYLTTGATPTFTYAAQYYGPGIMTTPEQPETLYSPL